MFKTWFLKNCRNLVEYRVSTSTDRVKLYLLLAPEIRKGVIQQNPAYVVFAR